MKCLFFLFLVRLFFVVPILYLPHLIIGTLCLYWFSNYSFLCTSFLLLLSHDYLVHSLALINKLVSVCTSFQIVLRTAFYMYILLGVSVVPNDNLVHLHALINKLVSVFKLCCIELSICTSFLLMYPRLLGTFARFLTICTSFLVQTETSLFIKASKCTK